MAEDGSKVGLIEWSEGCASVPPAIAQATMTGGARGDIRIAGGAAADTLVAGAGHGSLPDGLLSGAVSLIGGAVTDATATDFPRTMFTFGIGNDSPIAGGTFDVVHVVGGEADGRDAISGFRVDVENLRQVDFASTVAANAVTSEAVDEHSRGLTHLAGGTRIDMIGIGHLAQSMLI